MASYQSRRRDPLLDSTTQAALEKRSRELLGFGLIGLGLLVAVMIGTYSADDPRQREMIETLNVISNVIESSLSSDSS